MNLLHVRRHVARHGENVVGCAANQARRSGDGDGHGPAFLRRREAPPHVLRAPARREAKGHVARLRQSLRLPLEQRFVAEVVGDAGDRAGVARERDGGQGLPRHREAPQQLADEVARLRRAPAVAERDDFVPRPETLDERAPHRFRRGAQLLRAALDRAGVRGEVLRDET